MNGGSPYKCGITSQGVSMDEQTNTTGEQPTQPEKKQRLVLRVGARLPVDAYTVYGALIFRAGNVIKSERQVIRLLQPDVRFGRWLGSWGRPEPEAKLEIAPAEEEKPASASEAFRAVLLRAEIMGGVKSIFGSVAETGQVDIPAAQGMVAELVDALEDNHIAVASLAQLKDADSYTFTHSVNVCILATYLAMYMQYDKEMEHIGIGAILHDIGKVQLPDAVLRKQGPLNPAEQDLIRHHPSQGLELLIRSGFNDGIAITCVLDHHEKMTGGGYPRGKRACDISPYAKILALADIYDALTTDRPFRKAMQPHEAMELMVREMSSDLDPWLLRNFVEAIGDLLERTQVTPEGNVVLKGNSISKDTIKPIIQSIGPMPKLDSAA